MESQDKREELQIALEYIKTYMNNNEELANDSAVRCIASDPQTPAVVLRGIACEIRSIDILSRIAANPATSADVLAVLAKHPDKEVRLAVASNHNANMLVVMPLTTDDSPTVRFVLAENPFTDDLVLESLTLDENPFVAHRASVTIERLQNQ